MKKRLFLEKAGFVAVLIACGILIPMFSPLKLVLDPASFTLAVHVPIFVAMLISPVAALIVVVGTSLGFAFAGFSQVIVFRAVSHGVFALAGSLYLKDRPHTLSTFVSSQVFSLVIGIIHAGIEVTVVTFYAFTGTGVHFSTSSLLLLIGIGSLVHSMIDFGIALLILKPLTAQKQLRKFFVTSDIVKSI
jgi:niacin transporter